MELKQVLLLSEIGKALVCFLAACGIAVGLARRRWRKGSWCEQLLVWGLLAVGAGTLLGGHVGEPGLPDSWGKVLGGTVLANAGTALAALAMYLLTRRFHLETATLRSEADTDPLTGVYNLRAFLQELDRRLSRGGGFAVAILDVDNMKLVNDSLGHQVGDEVLKAMARALKKSTREEDTVARYGGDEFAVLLAGGGLPAEEFKARLAKNLVAELPSTAGMDVTVSVGMARFPEDGKDARSLLAAADTRMYAEKQAGKCGFVPFDQHSASLSAGCGSVPRGSDGCRQSSAAGRAAEPPFGGK